MFKCENSEISTTHYHTLKGKVDIKNIPQCSHKNACQSETVVDQGDQKGFLPWAGLCYLGFPVGKWPGVLGQETPPMSPKVAKATFLGFFCGLSHQKSKHKRTNILISEALPD